METTFVINKSELNNQFLSALKKLFKNQSQLQITVSVPEDFNLLSSESPKNYLARLERAIYDLDNNKNTIEFSEDDFKSMCFLN